MLGPPKQVGSLANVLEPPPLQQTTHEDFATADHVRGQMTELNQINVMDM